jgi:hypothetical protein
LLEPGEAERRAAISAKIKIESRQRRRDMEAARIAMRPTVPVAVMEPTIPYAPEPTVADYDARFWPTIDPRTLPIEEVD